LEKAAKAGTAEPTAFPTILPHPYTSSESVLTNLKFAPFTAFYAPTSTLSRSWIIIN
jgi:hypothetical protein